MSPDISKRTSRIVHAFYTHEFELKETNTQAVIEAIQPENTNGAIRSKQELGNVNGKDINCWFY
ncbi:MAG: hypothetical protein ACFWT6_01065 [Virgibacillus proomii]